MKINISMNLCIVFFLWCVEVKYIFGENKYSASANKQVNTEINFRTLERPFRMAKLNVLWAKAIHRLTESKLKSLFSELKIHDKEELTWKKMKSEGQDKEGLKEAEMRKKLTGIMSTYGLLEHFEDIKDPKQLKQHKALNEASDDYINKSMFKDKKLNKLWGKAESSGFTAEELQVLKEEFTHHQEKIDEYYSLLNEVEDGPTDNEDNSVDDKLHKYNMINEGREDNSQKENIQKDYLDKANLLRDKHQKIRDGYDHLYRLAAKGPESKEFVEPKVQGLWKAALQGNFTPQELESLRVELMHYENRLLKLRHWQAESVLAAERHAEKIAVAGDKTDGITAMEEMIKKHARKVEKMHVDIHSRIMQRHMEL